MENSIEKYFSFCMMNRGKFLCHLINIAWNWVNYLLKFPEGWVRRERERFKSTARGRRFRGKFFLIEQANLKWNVFDGARGLFVNEFWVNLETLSLFSEVNLKILRKSFSQAISTVFPLWIIYKVYALIDPKHNLCSDPFPFFSWKLKAGLNISI